MAPRNLVVLNQPVTELAIEEVARHVRDGSRRVHVVVPAIPPRHGLTYTEEEAHAVARRQLDRALRWFRNRGLRADGTIGDSSLLEATKDAVRVERFAGIIVVTRPVGPSRWIRMDLPSRMARAGIAGTCLVVDADASPDRSISADAGIDHRMSADPAEDGGRATDSIRTRRAS